MRSIIVVAAALALGCGSKKAETGSASGSGSASASGSGSASASAAPAPAKDAHPLPAAAVEKLKAYGAPHGHAVYIPAQGKDVEHWLAFVGGDAAMSAWLVTPSDKDHLLGQIGEWPTALQVDGAHLETTPHGFPGNEGTTFVYLLVTSRAGMGQPAGLHGVVRIGIDPAQYSSSVENMEDLIVPLAGVTDPEAISKKLDPVSAEMNTTMGLISDDAQTALGTTLSDPKTADAALAALIPKDGFGIATGWQSLFAKPTGKGKTVGDLRPLLTGKNFTCNYIACTSGGASTIATLGTEDGKVVIRDVIAPAAQPIGAGTRKLVPASATTAITERTLKELGFLDAKPFLEAPLSDRGGTLGLSHDGKLIARDGDYVIVGSVSIDDSVTPDMVKFVDVDGDGRTDVATAQKQDNGSVAYFFDLVDNSHDLPAGMAALGATDLNDAVTRALALEQHPVTADQACALLKSIKNKKSLAKAGPNAHVFAFEEPGEPEYGGDDLGKDSAKELHEDLANDCTLDCDATRPECERPAMGPDTDYFLFHWNGDKLELVTAMVYRGA